MTDSNKLIIRHYEDSDLPDLLRVWESSFRMAHPFLTEAFVAEVRTAIPNVFIPMAETWVAVRDQQLIGFMSLLQQEVGGLFVEPEQFGRGTGRALLDKAREQHQSLTVEVFEKNHRGTRFYTQYGFTETSRTTHEDTGEGLIRMSLTGGAGGDSLPVSGD